MMMKTINIRLSAAIFALVQILFAALFFWGGAVWFLNLQAGFFGSFLIIIGSFLGYKKMVNYKVSTYDNEPDMIDKMEDPYDIWSDENELSGDADKNASKNAAKPATLKGFFSPYRIASYMLFFVLFLLLVKSGNFAVILFLTGITCAPLSVILYEAARSFLFSLGGKI
jgi:hypothetical protein